MLVEHYIILILVFLNFLSILIGYILAKITNNFGVYSDRPKSFFDKHSNSNNPISKIEIDSGKFVTEINTSNLEKKYTSMGEEKISTENISESINKLKNIKR